MDWFPFTLETVIGFAAIAGWIAVGCFLIYAFWQTRNAGFIWLFVATVIWPFTYRIAERVVIHQMIGKHAPGMLDHILSSTGSSVGGLYLGLVYFDQFFRVTIVAIAAVYFFRHLPRKPSN